MMRKRSAASAGLLGLLLLLVAGFSTAMELVTLSSQTFEHQTQASTGQTTGHWCVLFVNGVGGVEAIEEAWEELAAGAEEMEYPAVFAKVDATASPDVARRFGLSQLPAAILLRDRLLYRLPHPLPGGKDDAVHSALDFLSGGWQERDAEPVPPESAGRGAGGGNAKAAGGSGGGGGAAAASAAADALAAALSAAGAKLVEVLGETETVLRVTGQAAAVVGAVILLLAIYIGVHININTNPAEGAGQRSAAPKPEAPAAAAAAAAAEKDGGSSSVAKSTRAAKSKAAAKARAD